MKLSLENVVRTSLWYVGRVVAPCDINVDKEWHGLGKPTIPEKGRNGTFARVWLKRVPGRLYLTCFVSRSALALTPRQRCPGKYNSPKFLQTVWTKFISVFSPLRSRHDGFDVKSEAHSSQYFQAILSCLVFMASKIR